MSVCMCLRGLPCRVLGFALCLWGLGVLTRPGSLAQIIGPEGLPLAGPNYIIPHDLGQTRGTNLFHRFLEFNIDTGESATFTGPDAIANIISLITGAHPSQIDGTIRSDIDGANLYLLNPNGVMFGANAQLNVTGSFHVSTADGVRFADGTIYTGDLGDASSLTVASPVAFGFMRESPSLAQPIVIEGSSLRVVPGQTLSVVGGDITIAGGSLLASGGSLNLISLGDTSSGHVPLDTSALPPELTEVEGLGGDVGTIAITNGATLSTNGNGGGQIVIRGGQLTVDQSAITSSNDGSLDSLGVGIDIGVTGAVQLINGSEVISSVLREGSGRGGDITVTAHEVLIAEGASIVTSGIGTGAAGNVRVHAETSVTIRDTEDDGLLAGIFSFAGFASPAGLVHVTGDRLVIDGGALGTSPDADIRRRSPRSGSVTVEVDRLMLTRGAQIDSSTSGDFPGGTVTITATEIASLSDGSVITVGTAGVENAGDITIKVGRLMLQGRSEIASESSGSGQAGVIFIEATDAIDLTAASIITADATMAGRAGNVDIRAHRLTLTDASRIASASSGSGDAGTITITADDIVLSASTVTTNANQANGGDIEIRAKTLGLNNSAITATVNEEQGAGGNITVDAELVLLEKSDIIARASEGRGGNIEIVATGFVTDAMSRISASSDKGINGTVNIESIIDLNENAAQLPQSFAEPLSLFQEPCAERLRGGQVSSFVVLGRDGVPAEPSGGLPSLMVEVPLGRGEATGIAHLAAQHQTLPARTWRQASLAYDCKNNRSRTAVSRHAP